MEICDLDFATITSIQTVIYTYLHCGAWVGVRGGGGGVLTTRRDGGGGGSVGGAGIKHS